MCAEVAEQDAKVQRGEMTEKEFEVWLEQHYQLCETCISLRAKIVGDK